MVFPPSACSGGGVQVWCRGRPGGSPSPSSGQAPAHLDFGHCKKCYLDERVILTKFDYLLVDYLLGSLISLYFFYLTNNKVRLFKSRLRPDGPTHRQAWAWPTRSRSFFPLFLSSFIAKIVKVCRYLVHDPSKGYEKFV